MRTTLSLLLSCSLATSPSFAVAGPSRDLVPASKPAEPLDVGQDFVTRIAAVSAPVTNASGRLRLMIAQLAESQPALEQMAPLAVPDDADPDLVLDVRTRALAASFAARVRDVRAAAARGDAEVVRAAVTEALGVMATAYALSAVNRGSRLSLQLWSAHVGGAAVGTAVTTLIALLAYLKSLDEPSALLTSLAAIVTVLAVGGVMNLRGNWQRLTDPARALAVLSVLRTEKLRLRVAHQNIAYFWSEVARAIELDPRDRSGEAIFREFQLALDERTLLPACERLLAHQNSVREVRVP